MYRGARQRRRLHAADPRCHYCGVETVLDPPVSWKATTFPQLATVEHLRPRTHPLRQEPMQVANERRHVLACWRCNQDRANRLPLEARRALSRIGHVASHEERNAARAAVLARVGEPFHRRELRRRLMKTLTT